MVNADVSLEGASISVSGQVIRTSVTEVSGTFPFLYVTQSGKDISGIPHKLVVAFSGETSIAKISGETVISEISGSIVNISGNKVRFADFSTFDAYPILKITGASGGTPLDAGTSTFVSIRGAGHVSGTPAAAAHATSISGVYAMLGYSGTNKAPWMGGTSGFEHFSGRGLVFSMVDGITIPITNPALVRIVAPERFSGTTITYMSYTY